MPLIIMSGYPSSGKSSHAIKLSNYFREVEGRDVHIVKEEEHFRGEKNDILDDSKKEKELRARLKSEAQRLLSKTNVVILDGLNYIKGYRYELYCMSKAVPTRQVTIQCDISEQMAWDWNMSRPDSSAQYTREVFDHLIQRFEAPDSQNRWDSPFFNVLPGEDLNYPEISKSLFLNAPPKPNQATQNKPLSSSNYLQTLEKVTSEIVQAIISTQNGDEKEVNEENVEEEEFGLIQVPYSKVGVKLGEDHNQSLAQLNKLKRQFISLTRSSHKANTTEIEEIGDLFVQYLNSQL